MELTIVNPHPKYPRVAGLIESPPTGYLLLAAVVWLTVGRTPFPRRSPRKAALLTELKALAASLEGLKAVTKATVYRAALIPPPGSDARRMAARPARYYVVTLIETITVEAAGDVAASPEYQKLHDAIAAAAREEYLMTARCLRRVGDVDKSRPGSSCSTTSSPRIPRSHWTCGTTSRPGTRWRPAWTTPRCSARSTPADYVFVNHARWDMSLPRFAVRQFGKRTFYSYVLANLHANGTASMPILYRLA